eukprot:c19427_g1_i2 orf=160-552(+)
MASMAKRMLKNSAKIQLMHDTRLYLCLLDTKPYLYLLDHKTTKHTHRHEARRTAKTSFDDIAIRKQRNILLLLLLKELLLSLLKLPLTTADTHDDVQHGPRGAEEDEGSQGLAADTDWDRYQGRSYRKDP